MHNLVKKVKTIKKNSNYRIGDILFQKGARWTHSMERVKTDKTFFNTVLYNYLLNNKDSKKINKKLFLKCLKDFKNNNPNIKKPKDNELVIHLRMGDVVEIPTRYLKRPYLELIRNQINIHKNLIEKITIVTCFQYGEWEESSLHLRTEQPLWNFTKKKNLENKKSLSNLIKQIENEFKLELNIISNNEIDKDIYYCVFAKFLIVDKGGLDILIKQLNRLHLYNDGQIKKN